MGRGAWWAPVHGVARTGHNLETELDGVGKMVMKVLGKAP